MKILALEISTAHGSLAVWEAGAVLYSANFGAERGHSAQLFTKLEEARPFCAGCDLIAVGLGPGSYSGVRIAIAAALGLSAAWSVPIVGLASVAALEVNASHYAVIGDARRETFYFAEVRDGVCLEGPLLLAAPALLERLAICNGPVFTSEPVEVFPGAESARPAAALLAENAAAGRGILQRDALEPLYLRAPHITLPKAPLPR